MSDESTSNSPEWDAFTAADPASELYVDLAAIRQSVDTGTMSTPTVIPLTKRTWIKPAAVAAGIALVIGSTSGYTIAAMNDGEGMPTVYNEAQVDTPAANAISAPGLADSRMQANGLSASSSKYSSAIWPGYGGRPYLRPTSQLTDESAKSVGYRLDDTGIKRKTEIKKIAEVFGVKGKISGTVKDGLMIGDETWAGPIVQFNGSSYDKQAAWNYSDQSVAPQMCGETKDGGVIGIAGNCKKATGTAPTSESAIALAQDLFGQIGLAADQAEWSAFDTTMTWGMQDSNPSAFLTVTANVLVEGKPSGLQWQMAVGPDNAISSASGFLASFTSTPTYDIVGAKTAVLRSQDARWINLGPQEQYRNGGYPMPLAYAKGTTTLEGDVAMSNPSTPAVEVDSDGLPILDAGLDPESITSATPALVQWWLVDGTTILLPGYKLVADQGTSSVDDDRTWLQIAIADKYVSFN